MAKKRKNERPILGTWNRVLARSAADLLRNGREVITPKQIAKKHFGQARFGPETVGGIRKRLSAIKKIVQEVERLDVVLVSDTYFDGEHEENPPTSQAAARRCLSGLGRGISAAGIKLCLRADTDLIWQEDKKRNLVGGGGKVKKTVDIIHESVQLGRLNTENAAEIVMFGTERLVPDNLEVMKSINDVIRMRTTKRLKGGSHESTP